MPEAVETKQPVEAMPGIDANESFLKATEELNAGQKNALLEMLECIRGKKKISLGTCRRVSAYDFRNLRMSECAEIFGTSRQMVMDWVNKGCPKNEHGGFSVPEIVKWRLDKATGKEGNGGSEKELTKEKIEKLRIENAIKRNEYLPKNEVVERVVSSFIAVGNMIRRAIKLSAPMVVGSTSALQNEQILIAQYKKALAHLKAKVIIEDWVNKDGKNENS